jgi:hypothetical protein
VAWREVAQAGSLAKLEAQQVAGREQQRHEQLVSSCRKSRLKLLTKSCFLAWKRCACVPGPLFAVAHSHRARCTMLRCLSRWKVGALESKQRRLVELERRVRSSTVL